MTWAKTRRHLVSFYGISLIIGLGSTVVFVLLADAVLSERLLDLNLAIVREVHARANATLDSIALTLTWIGSTFGIIAISTAFAWYLIARRAVVDTVAFGVSVLGSVALTWALKAIFRTTRPQLFTPLESVTSPSFPSGHTLTSFCTLGFIAFWLIREQPRQTWRWIAGGFLLALAALIGASRVYIGVHWPTDVAGGILIATVWIVTSLVGEQRARSAAPN